MALSILDGTKLTNYFKTQPVVVVYLFGSQATGMSNLQSDIDIALLFDESVKAEERFNKKLEIMGMLTILLNRDDVDVVVLNDASIAMKFAAIKPMEIIYEKDRGQQVVFQAKALSDYQDYSYYIKKNTMNSLGSIAQI